MEFGVCVYIDVDYDILCVKDFYSFFDECGVGDV